MLTLSTACLYGRPLRSIFRSARDLGFDGLELVINEEVWLRGLDHVARLAREESLPIINVHQALTRLNPSGKGHGRIVDATRAGLRLGVRNVVFHCPFADDWDDPEVQEWLEALRQSQELVRGSDVLLSIENSGINHHLEVDRLLGRTERLAAFAQERDLCVTFDTCHAGTMDQPIAESYALISRRMTNIHLSDLRHGPLGRNHYLRGFFCHHQMLGEGLLPLHEFLTLVYAQGYQGPVTLEISPIALRYWSPRLMRQRLLAAAEFVRKAQQEGLAVCR